MFFLIKAAHSQRACLIAAIRKCRFIDHVTCPQAENDNSIVLLILNSETSCPEFISSIHHDAPPKDSLEMDKYIGGNYDVSTDRTIQALQYNVH